MSVTKDQVQERVVEALASFGPDADSITSAATFEELDIDSLDLVELGADRRGRIRRGAEGRGHEGAQDRR